MSRYAATKANFCLGTGVQPDQYDALTRLERDAFATETKKRK